MKRPFRVLSIDGGGIRGILAGQILARLEQILIHKTGNPSARIAKYFDLFAGTSTGGILTCLYLSPGSEMNEIPRFSASDAVQLYMKNGKRIFRSSSGGEQEKYSSFELESVMDEYFLDLKLSQLLKPCIITSFNLKKKSAHFLTQHDAVEKHGYDFFVKDVARATSAFPGYFSAANVSSVSGNPYTLVDGGVFANNPALCAYAEALAFFGRRTGTNLSPSDLFMLSIGTGKGAGSGFSSKEIAENEALLARESETTDFQLRQIFDASNASSNYIRLEPGLGRAKGDLDDISDENLNALSDAGKNSGERFNELLENIAERILE